MENSLHRGYSDTMAFVPRNPSRLGPGRGNSGRGTVSMPNSPILGHRTVDIGDPWQAQPQTAQVFFDIPQQKPHTDQGWYTSLTGLEPYASPSSDSVPLSIEEPQQAAEQVDTEGGIKKKRAQVRIACTNCQKACKKCSNTRPCERCIKYGFKDCVDSTRRPRKTGIKRGPYKRRTSKFLEGNYYPISQSYHNTNQQYQQHQINVQGYTDKPTAQDTISHRHNGYYQIPRQTSPQPHHSSTSEHLQTPRVPRQPASLQLTDSLPGNPPGPRTAVLHGAFASALNGPRWVHGQRTSSISAAQVSQGDTDVLQHNNHGHRHGHGGGGIGDGGGSEVLYPPTPSVPFPISLNHRNDPFSRAVSPIHSTLDDQLTNLKGRIPGGSGSGNGVLGQIQPTPQAIQAALLNEFHLKRFSSDPISALATSNGDIRRGLQHDNSGDLSSVSEMGKNDTSTNANPLFTDPFAQSLQQTPYQSHQSVAYHTISAPSSPRQSNNHHISQTTRSSSAEAGTHESFQQPHLPHLLQLPHHSQQQYPIGVPPPGMITLRKIRKPSLRTLISHAGSQAPSRATSPESQSPTLFDQPMTLDDSGIEVDHLHLHQHNPGTRGERESRRETSRMANMTDAQEGILGFGFDNHSSFSA